jgi:adenylate kinase
MRIWIHNCNSYIGKALAKELRRDKDDRGNNRLFGCLSGDGEKPAAVKKLLTRDDPKKAKRMEETIQRCSTVIVDLFNSTLEDLQFIISALKVDPKANPPRITGEIQDADGNRKDFVTLILISSVMVWADTKVEASPTDIVEEAPTATEVVEEETPAEVVETGDSVEAKDEAVSPPTETVTGPITLSDAHFEKRKPMPNTKYEQWLQRENLVRSCFSLEGSQVKCFIVGAGVLYGDGEETFTQIFKDAWLGVKSHQVFSPGHNIVPTVHVRDVARLVRQVAYNQELVPAEKPYFLAVDKVEDSPIPTQANIIGGIVGEVSGPYDIPLVSAPELPQESEGVLQDALTEALSLNLTMEPSSLMLEETFEWHCHGGLLKNVRKVAEEFCAERQLRALRVIVSGPPSSGKTTLCKAVSEHFNTPHLEMKPEDLDFTRKQVCSEVCRYRGYVLDAGLVGYKEVDSLFCYDHEVELEPEEEEEYAQAVKEAEENEMPPPEKPIKTERRLKEEIVPTFVVALQAPEALCRARGTSHGAQSVDQFQKDMAQYTEKNLTDGVYNFSDFFQEKVKTGVFNLPIAGKDEEDLFESIRIYMEGGQGRPFNYLPSESDVAQRLLAKQQDQEATAAMNLELERQASANSSAVDSCAVSKRHDERLRIISAHEEQRKQIEAMPLREYLMRYMVPNLTEGLIEMCKVTPDNPVDSLANYLEEHSARDLN